MSPLPSLQRPMYRSQVVLVSLLCFFVFFIIISSTTLIPLTKPHQPIPTYTVVASAIVFGAILFLVFILGYWWRSSSIDRLNDERSSNTHPLSNIGGFIQDGNHRPARDWPTSRSQDESIENQIPAQDGNQQSNLPIITDSERRYPRGYARPSDERLNATTPGFGHEQAPTAPQIPQPTFSPARYPTGPQVQKLYTSPGARSRQASRNLTPNIPIHIQRPDNVHLHGESASYPPPPLRMQKNRTGPVRHPADTRTSPTGPSIDQTRASGKPETQPEGGSPRAPSRKTASRGYQAYNPTLNTSVRSHNPYPAPIRRQVDIALDSPCLNGGTDSRSAAATGPHSAQPATNPTNTNDQMQARISSKVVDRTTPPPMAPTNGAPGPPIQGRSLAASGREGIMDSGASMPVSNREEEQNLHGNPARASSVPVLNQELEEEDENDRGVVDDAMSSFSGRGPAFLASVKLGSGQDFMGDSRPGWT